MMKILRYVVMVALMFGLSRVAHGYAITILDPPSTDSPFFLMQPGQPFSFGFAACPEFLADQGWLGCAVGFNDSFQTITSIDLSYENTLGGAGVTCSSNAFDNISCGLNADQTAYELSFVDSPSGGIPPLNFVLILENAVSGPDFPDVAGVTNTPEPASIWLALSGLGSAGYLVRRRRRPLSV